ncbi:Membrane protein involved in the export of O-antigen and teichoic acid [Fodinibius salinus]|uniref:Membrane protein involved in the export of O-antigen and teichoic acid n=1 Tax=Fodinibius salinus TaxID=860790 RepID=A0A5D3YHI9_9BACT|nr:oligosaccharide flippase family protein [Fodinibius salinus]TYP91719.1 Membrane protein involved in the export of O-antigen and teichoic acid [Fodinibius salinus]
MGVIFRQSIQNSIINYAGIAIGFVVTIWMYPNILSPEEYGLTRVLISLAMVSSQLASLGMKNTVIRFFPFFRDKENNHNGFLFLSMAVPFLGVILLAGILAIFRPGITQYFIERSELLVGYYWFILPLAFSMLYFHVTTSFVQALYDTVMSSFLMNVAVRLLTMLLLVIHFMGWISFEQFMVGFVMNYAIILLALIIYMYSIADLSLTPHIDFLDRSLLKRMVKYSLFAFFGGIASIIVSNIDIIMLSSLAGLDDTGIYSIAFYIGSAITIMRQSIYKISSPIIADAYEEQNFDLIEQIYHRSSMNQLIAAGLLFAGVIANLENLMAVLPPEYSGGALVIIIIGTANIFDMATGVNGAIILNSDHYRFDLYSSLILIAITIILNYILIPIYGIVGAAIGTASAVLLYNMLKVLFVWIYFSMQPFEWRMLYILGGGAITLLIVFQIPVMGGVYLDILIRSIIVTLLYGVPLWMLDISDELNQLVDTTLNEINKRIF